MGGVALEDIQKIKLYTSWWYTYKCSEATDVIGLLQITTGRFGCVKTVRVGKTMPYIYTKIVLKNVKALVQVEYMYVRRLMAYYELTIL